MPNDVITINALVNELNTILQAGRIDKISQPEKDEIMLTIRATNLNHNLVISVNPNNPRVHITHNKKDNPYVAPPFTMHLRKHIQGARIQAIFLPNADRLICFELNGKNELRDEVKYYLYVEIMGRYSNIILTDGEQKITDALRHFPPDDKQRCILPHITYVLPNNPKLSPFDTDDIYKILLNMSGVSLYDYAQKHIGGLASTTLLEVIYRSKLTPDMTTLYEEEAKAFISNLINIANIHSNQKLYLPCLAKKPHGGYEDYFVYPYTHSGKSFAPVSSLNEAIDIITTQKDREVRLAASSKNITAALNRSIQKATRYIKHATIKLEESKKADMYRIYGELITCNLHYIKKGMETVTLYNYYEDKNIVIQLNPLKNPQSNAQDFYKKYNKLKRTHDIVSKQLLENNELLEYLLSIKQNLLMAEEVTDLEEIKAELQKIGLIKKVSEKTKRLKAKPEALPVKYNIDGFTVLRGKNNLQNDKLTFKIANQNDIWLHAKGGHGAHIVIIGENKEVSIEVITKAAEIAAYYSEFRNNNKVEIDYTIRKNVLRHPSNKSGMVIYTKYKSIAVKPSKRDNLIAE